MGWCSGTDIFDGMCETILSPQLGLTERQRGRLLRDLISALEDHDWDCQLESDFYDNEEVMEAFYAVHPDWDEEDRQG